MNPRLEPSRFQPGSFINSRAISCTGVPALSQVPTNVFSSSSVLSREEALNPPDDKKGRWSVEEDRVWTLSQTALDSHSSSTTRKSRMKVLDFFREVLSKPLLISKAREETFQLTGPWALSAEFLHAPSLFLIFLEYTRSTSYIILVPAPRPSLVLEQRGSLRSP